MGARRRPEPQRIAAEFSSETLSRRVRGLYESAFAR